MQFGAPRVRLPPRVAARGARRGGAAEAASGQGRRRHWQDHAGRGGGDRAGHAALPLAYQVDVGGSPDDHVRSVEDLFSAARSEFKHLEYYYFHNCPYEWLWRGNGAASRSGSRRWTSSTYPPDYRVVLVGDATMSPYELVEVGGANEHRNNKPGVKWLTRLAQTWRRTVWLNPQPEEWWDAYQSIQIVRRLLEDRMYPLTLTGLDGAIRALR